MEVLEAVGDDGGRISGIGEISRPSKKNFLSFFFAFFPDLSSFVIKSMVLGMQKL